MNNEIMEQATDQINFQDDKLDSGMGLGNSLGLSETGPTIDLEIPNPTQENYDPLETEISKTEEDTTNYEQKLWEIEQEIEKYESIYENINNKMDINKLFDILSDQKFKKIFDMTKDQYRKDLYGLNNPWATPKFNNEKYITLENTIREQIGKQLQKLRTTRDSYKDNPNYDNRTDAQKREDKLREEAIKREDEATSRAVEQMKKAGLNPATLQGNISYGGGGGVSSGGRSKAEEDEEERRRRKREREIAEAARKQMVMQIIQMLGGIGGTLGGAAIRNMGLMGMADIRNQGYIEAAKIRRDGQIKTAEINNWKKFTY